MNDPLLGAVDPRQPRMLHVDERLIWWGTPNSKRYALRRASESVGVGLILILIGCGIFYWEVFRSGREISFLFLVFVAGISCLGLWSVSKIWKNYREAASVLYFLSDRRAVIATQSSVKSVAIRSIRLVELIPGDNGTGDVLFLDELVPSGEDGTRNLRDGFIGIAAAAAVEREMLRLQMAAAA